MLQWFFRVFMVVVFWVWVFGDFRVLQGFKF